MQSPLFWLLLSFLLVALSLTAVLAAAFPAFLELGRAARSAEKLMDTLNREIPRTLEALRRTGGDLADFTDELEASVKSAKGILKQTEQSIIQTRQQIRQVHHHSHITWTGIKTAWNVFRRPATQRNKLASQSRRKHRP